MDSFTRNNKYCHGRTAKNRIKKNIFSRTVSRRLHQEDFSQALGIAASNKYEKNNEGYLKKLFDVLRSHSADTMTDSFSLDDWVEGFEWIRISVSCTTCLFEKEDWVDLETM